jgi:DNA-directed RNA polymerase specialized sigma24 family protein
MTKSVPDPTERDGHPRHAAPNRAPGDAVFVDTSALPDAIEVPSSIPTDAELIAATQDGNTAAYAELFGRHQAAAMRLARLLTKNRGNAEDLASLAYTRTFDELYTGAGPEVGFRTYLLAAVQCLHEDLVRAAGGDPAESEPLGLVPAVEGAAGAMAAGAFAALPERWQAALWHTSVEGESAAKVAPLLGLSPQGVEALAFRAREGLRQYYARHHLDGAHPKRCRATIGRLGVYTRDGLTERERTQIRQHLEKCERCSLLHAQLAEINDRLPALLGPVVLGAYSTPYLNATETESAKWSAAFVRIRHGLSATRGIAMAGAAAAAAVALVAWAATAFVNGTFPSTQDEIYAGHGAGGWRYPPGGVETLAPMANSGNGTSPLNIGGQIGAGKAWYADAIVPRPRFGGSGPIPVPPPLPGQPPPPPLPSEPGPAPTSPPGPEPTSPGPEPTSPGPKPTSPDPRPTTNTPGPTPTTPSPTPTDPDPTPTTPSPTPTDPDPTPTDPEPTPTDPEPTPTDPEPTPSEPEPTPSEPEPEPTPSEPEPTPSDPEPTPSEPTSTCDPNGLNAPSEPGGTQVPESAGDVPAKDCSESPSPTESPTASPVGPATWMQPGPRPVFVLAPGSP